MPPKKLLKKKWSLILLILLVCGIGMQFVRPALPNPPVTGDLSAPPEVKHFLERACYDCHSNQTNLAWFDQAVPAYWLVRQHVLDGRKVLNFSQWDSLPREQQKGKLFECLNQAAFHVMPLSQYVTFHSGAKVSAQDIVALQNYLDTLAPANTADPKRVRAGDDQYLSWAAGGIKQGAVQPAANGIAYTDAYKNWAVISTTERWDNGTLRVILGNETAIRAIREHHTNPWPKGTQFAKVAWDAVKDSTGNVHTGEFKQVEFMIKDGDKYAATDGWGWARWKGTQLRPYGKTAVFTTECTNCHKPMQDNDAVFSIPINRETTLSDTLSFHPLKWKVISSTVNRKDNTMSTLYGNDTALQYARRGLAYPAGSVIALVTWSQREDPHWHGAFIPESIQSIERVRFAATGSGGTAAEKTPFLYEKYEGKPLRKIVTDPVENVHSRIMYLVSQKASVIL